MADTDYAILKPKHSGQRRLLALDGGGIRGLVTLGILEKLEADLRAASGTGASFRLSDYFDFIGGTSTGAILAAGLAIGKSVEDLIAFYRTCGAQMLEANAMLKRAWSKFKSDPIEAKLKEVFGENTELGSDKLKTLLLVVMRNVTTDSPWPVTNNPRAKYNDRSRHDCNLDLPLWQLVRASTAAPTYFPPEVVQIGERQFVFVDGGVTPYNVPAFVLYRNAVALPFKLNWETGERKMLNISIGTGSTPRLGPDAQHPSRSVFEVALGIAGELMNGMAYDQDINCRTTGRCVFGPPLDREVGTLIPNAPLDQDLGRNFLYARYDPELSREGLDELGVAAVDPARVAKLDSIEVIDDLLLIGRRYAEKYLQAETHIGPFLPRGGQ
jgi:predicted acylesterase/phospholipase RssA